MERPDFERINALMEQKKPVFEAFYALLTEYNERFNLTAVTDREGVTYKHFIDSLAGESIFPQNARAVEIGSGGGFPSIPLKIVRDDLELTLVESTGKKCEFLRTAVRELGLSGVTVLNARAEDLGKDVQYRETFDVCFARAVAAMNVLAEYCMPLVRVGGIFLAYKGNAEEELHAAANAVKLLGGKRAESVSYELPNGYGARCLISVKKASATPSKYPRGNGRERKQPL